MRDTLETLRKGGIITMEHRGNQTICSLNLSVLEEVALELTELLNRRPEPEYRKEET